MYIERGDFGNVSPDRVRRDEMVRHEQQAIELVETYYRLPVEEQDVCLEAIVIQIEARDVVYNHVKMTYERLNRDDPDQQQDRREELSRSEFDSLNGFIYEMLQALQATPKDAWADILGVHIVAGD
jgi:hypothetical protein